MDTFRYLIITILLGWVGVVGTAVHAGEDDPDNPVLIACRSILAEPPGPETDQQLAKKLSQLLSEPRAREQISFLIENANDIDQDRILSILRTCDKAQVLTVLERVVIFTVPVPKLEKKLNALTSDLVQAMPLSEQLKLAESIDRPRRWAISIASEQQNAESARVEALYCRWAETELQPATPYDADELYASRYDIYERDVVRCLVEMNSAKTIRALLESIDRYREAHSLHLVLPMMIEELKYCDRPEVIEAMWRLALNREPDQQFTKFQAIEYLSLKVDQAGADRLVAELEQPANEYNVWTRDQLLLRVLDKKRNLSKQNRAATGPATQPATTQPIATQPSSK